MVTDCRFVTKRHFRVAGLRIATTISLSYADDAFLSVLLLGNYYFWFFSFFFNKKKSDATYHCYCYTSAATCKVIEKKKSAPPSLSKEVKNMLRCVGFSFARFRSRCLRATPYTPISSAEMDAVLYRAQSQRSPHTNNRSKPFGVHCNVLLSLSAVIYLAALALLPQIRQVPQVLDKKVSYILAGVPARCIVDVRDG